MNIKRTLLLAPLAVVVLLILVDLLIVTDQERIDDLVERGQAASEAGDYETVQAMISRDYRFEGRDRDAFLELAQSTLELYAPMKIMLFGEETFIGPEDRALVEFMAVVTPGEKSRLPGAVRCFWKIHLAREGDAWLVTGVKAALTKN